MRLLIKKHARDEIVSRLFARTTQGIKFGLERIGEAANQLGNPHHHYNIIHVAGTNGKGSVCAFLESLLRHKGYTTGLFTSPHLVFFEERFISNGTCVRPGEWLEIYCDIEKTIDRYSLTFFEISTLIALVLFKRRQVDWAILETGLGGRLDATNIVTPKATVITSLSVDHTEYLGNDIFSVAREKLGIIESGVPLVMMNHSNAKVMALAQQRCEESRSSLIVVAEEGTDPVKGEGGDNNFYYKNLLFKVPLYGKYQIINALLAIKTIEALDMSLDEKATKAIKETFLPGRFQVVNCHGKEIVFDTAHNPEAASLFCKEVRKRFKGFPICIIAGIMKDKDKINMLDQYMKIADSIIFTRPETDRATAPEVLKEMISNVFKGEVLVKDTVSEAVSFACETCDGVICVTGSFYTVGEAMTALNMEPYSSRN